MRAAIIVLVLALAVGQASAWKLKHKKHRHSVCNPKYWDRVFAVKGQK